MKVLNLITILILLTNTHLAYTKDVKFHAPETEAEKALDKILRTEEGLDLGQMKYEDITTKAFRADEARQQAEYEERWGCKKGMGDLCDFSDTGHITNSQDILTDIGFLYYTLIEGKAVHILLLPLGYKSQPNYYNGKIEFYKSDFNRHNFRQYIMKKEDGKWKIDGNKAGDFKINFK
jgi:hypothetical protein